MWPLKAAAINGVRLRQERSWTKATVTQRNNCFRIAKYHLPKVIWLAYISASKRQQVNKRIFTLFRGKINCCATTIKESHKILVDLISLSTHRYPFHLYLPQNQAKNEQLQCVLSLLKLSKVFRQILHSHWLQLPIIVLHLVNFHLDMLVVAPNQYFRHFFVLAEK